MNSISPKNPSGKPSSAHRALRHFRRNVVAYLALFLALSGSAYAVERGSVGTKQLKKAAVKTGKIADGAVTSRKLAAGSVDGPRLAGGAVDTGKIAGGAVDASKIANGAVTRDKLAPGAVTKDQVGLIHARADIDDTNANGDGTVKDIFTHGPFTIRARCQFQSNGSTWFSAFVKSSEKATSLQLPGSPHYRVEPNSFRSLTQNVVALVGGGTTAFPVSLWTESGRYLQVSVIATSRTYAAKNDCSYLITGFAG